MDYFFGSPHAARPPRAAAERAKRAPAAPEPPTFLGPTWTSAREHGNEHGVWGSGGVRSMQAPARDMPNHTVMKYRAGHQLEGVGTERAELIEKRLAV